ncbi:MAG: DASS family sodium-coupled anion symporter [Acidobacteria bacterium]|nr:DASS family sodium-coupled anion symporter [Acidobacteriota bacterium]
MFVGLFLFAAILLAPAPEGMSPAAQSTAAVAALMAAWWITETTDIAVTALLPIAIFPLLGVMSADEVATHFADHIVFLYLGGFLIALGMERWNLHRRLALGVIRRVGSRPSLMMLGFMLATAFLSMWISNTATTMMMLPIAVAVVNQLADLASIDGQRDDATADRIRRSFGVILLLGIAYAASVGGIGTIIGSPTTVAFLGFLQQSFPNERPIAFADWTLVCLPIVVVFLPISWLYLARFGSDIPLSRIRFSGGMDVILNEQRKLGPMSFAEKYVLGISVTTALLWITRRPLEIGGFSLPGWSDLFDTPGALQDSTVAMAMASVLFLTPSGEKDAEGRSIPVLDWGTAARGVPWGVVFLFGGGFALAAAIADTGLASWIGGQLSGLEGAPLWLLVPMSCLLAVTLTETTSNIATVLMLSPVIGAAAVEIGVHPYLMLIPAAIMANFAFMLPVATPPNAIVFSSGWITIPQMFRAGLILDLIALVIVPVMVYALGSLFLGF